MFGSSVFFCAFIAARASASACTFSITRSLACPIDATTELKCPALRISRLAESDSTMTVADRIGGDCRGNATTLPILSWYPRIALSPKHEMACNVPT